MDTQTQMHKHKDTLLHTGGDIQIRQTNNTVHADTHTHWEVEVRPHVGICGCHDAQKEVNAQDGH